MTINRRLYNFKITIFFLQPIVYYTTNYYKKTIAVCTVKFDNSVSVFHFLSYDSKIYIGMIWCIHCYWVSSQYNIVIIVEYYIHLCGQYINVNRYYLLRHWTERLSFVETSVIGHEKRVNEHIYSTLIL